MKRDPEFFQDREMTLMYVAKRLRDALKLETLLTGAGIEYAVETGKYHGGVIFRSERTGAFFYVLPEAEGRTRNVMVENGFEPFEEP